VALGLIRKKGEDAGAHERSRVDADPADTEQPLRLPREEFRVPGTRADKMDDHLVLSFNNPHRCISTTSSLKAGIRNLSGRQIRYGMPFQVHPVLPNFVSNKNYIARI
jgi:hypothetical protein